MLKKILVYFCVYFIFFNVVWSTDIKVLVEKNRPYVWVKVKGGCQVKDLSTGKLLLHLNKSFRGYLVNDKGKLRWDRYLFDASSIKILPLKKNVLYLKNRNFTGNLIVYINKSNFINVVNVLDVEEYLKGVVPNEVPFWWPIEALKAQSIVARTFAYYKIEENKEKNYDVLDTTFSQVYKGKSTQRWKTDLAVLFTKDKVLVYKDKLFPAYYHSCCGGHTESGEFFGIKIPPLKGKVCPFCKNTRFYKWKRKISKKYAIKRLRKYGYVLSDIKDIKILERTPSGRAWMVGIQKETSSYIKVWAPDLRTILGARIILSNLYKVYLRKNYIYFEGRGWGHGVGMCQWGAYVMSKKGYNYKEILNFYYPGAEIKNVHQIRRFKF